MSDEFHLRRGAHMRRKGGLWKVTKFDNGRILIKNLDTDEPDELTLEAWRKGCHEGEIEMVGARRAGLIDRQQLRSGAYMRRKDLLWRVRLVKDGVIHLEDVRTGETDRLRVEEWRRGCYEGAIEMVADPNTDLPEAVRELLLVPLMNQPESMRIATLDAAVFVLAYRDPLAFYERKLPEVKPDARHLPVHLSKRWIQPFLAEVAQACGKRRPGFSTFCKWLQKVDLANGDIRALAPRYDRRGPHHRYMDPRVEQWLNDCIDTEWLNSNRNDKKKVREALEAKIDEWNEKNPQRPLKLPSQGHVNRYIRETVDCYTAARRRYGKEYADRLFKQVSEGPKTTFAFERVEVDHTETDLPVCHDETHVYLGRPWITTALDHYSRMPLAIHVHFEGGTSLTAVFQCLHNLMSPKGFLRKLVPEVDYDYPWGVPVGFFFDHGSDFDNPHVRAVGATFSIRIDHSPADCPYFKAAIERFWRTVCKALEALGHPVTAAGASIQGETVPIAVTEKQDRTPHVATAAELARVKAHSWEKIPTWDYSPSGRLSIHSDCYVYNRTDLRKRWSDGRGVRLEDVLRDVLLGLVAVGAARRRESDERRAAHDRFVEQQRQRAEAERLARVEAARDKGVLDSARLLGDAEAVRRLVAAVKHRAARDGSAAIPGLDAWLLRAEAVAAGLDPTSGGVEEMLARHEEEVQRIGNERPKPQWGV